MRVFEMTTKTKPRKTVTKTKRDYKELDAQLAFEQELLVGLTVDLMNALANASELTQRELADRLGITEGRMSQILSGDQNISLKKLAAFGWALGFRFELRPVALDDRRGTPAVDDPEPPQWVARPNKT
jgi:predicted XRE-type DNA-binding protein